MRRMISFAPVVALAFVMVACSDDSGPTSDTIVGKDGSVDTSSPDGPGGDGPGADQTTTDGPPAADLPPADLPPPTTGIAAARQAPDGATNVTIKDAFVTYIKPAIGNDRGGFMIQTVKVGPALFVGVEPQTVTPSPKVGERIDLTITEMDTDSTGIRYAKAITGVTTTTPGTDPLPGLVQDVSNATDLVTNVKDYEVELISGTFTITKPFASAGTGFLAAEADTAAITGNTELRFRVPETLRDQLGLVVGCVITLKATPMWYFKSTAQPSANDAADIDTLVCPKPTVTGASAQSPTSVRISFDRPLTTVNANGSEFSFDNGLTASAATLDASGLFVDVTTSAQTSATVYTATVAASVGVDAAKNTATFTGYTTPAAVVINELNANITSSCDLIELRVTSAGSLSNFTVWERDSLLYTFPGSFPVAAGDIVVLHLDSADIKCNPSSATDELTSKTQFPVASNAKNYDAAWDLWAKRAGLIGTTNVFRVLDPTGTIVDALLAHDGTAGSVAGQTVATANLVATANEWTPIPSGGYTAANFRADSVTGLKATSTTAAGDSLQRTSATDTNAKADWAIKPSSFGLKNAGQ
jgi:hypothetical protein